MFCKFRKIDDDLYQCQRCGFTDTITVFPVFRRCNPFAQLPRKPQEQPDPRRQITAAIEQALKEGYPTQTRKQIKATLDRCFGGCMHFNGKTCTRSGSECRHWQRWLERLVFSGCEGPAEWELDNEG